MDENRERFKETKQKQKKLKNCENYKIFVKEIILTLKHSRRLQTIDKEWEKLSTGKQWERHY